MRRSARPDSAGAIAGFSCVLEALHAILYTSLEDLAAECTEYPTPPTWREREVSAKLHATGCGVDRGAGDGRMVDDAEWKRDPHVYLVLF